MFPNYKLLSHADSLRNWRSESTFSRRRSFNSVERRAFTNSVSTTAPSRPLSNREVILHGRVLPEPPATARGRRSYKIFGRAIAGIKSEGTAVLVTDARLIV